MPLSWDGILDWWDRFYERKKKHGLRLHIPPLIFASYPWSQIFDFSYFIFWTDRQSSKDQGMTTPRVISLCSMAFRSYGAPRFEKESLRFLRLGDPFRGEMGGYFLLPIFVCRVPRSSRTSREWWGLILVGLLASSFRFAPNLWVFIFEAFVFLAIRNLLSGWTLLIEEIIPPKAKRSHDFCRKRRWGRAGFLVLDLTGQFLKKNDRGDESRLI